MTGSSHDRSIQRPLHYPLCSTRKYPYSPHKKGLEFPGEVGGSLRPKNLKKCIEFKWNFQRGGGRSWKKYLPWGRYGYFLELHICTESQSPMIPDFVVGFILF